MEFSRVAEYYEKIEATTKRLEMTNLLANLLGETSKNEIKRVIYLTQGKLGPDFINNEIGIAEKLAIQAVSRAVGRSESEILLHITKTGDIGKTTQELLDIKTQAALFHGSKLTIETVYATLDKIAQVSGSGSTGKKINLLAGLLANASPNEAKYIMRIVTGTLRLGIADMTVLDALAITYGGGKESRDSLERAYNISSDLGKVASTVAEKGLQGIKNFHVSVGSPLRPMLAERLSSPEEILEKLGGKCVAEFKYDGERVQAHKKGNEIELFSRRLEIITKQYPDVALLLRQSVKSQDAILEAECVAIDSNTGEMRPFQDLMHRRRKYGIHEAMKEYPVSLFIFDVLYSDGKDFTLTPYPSRRKQLEQMISVNDQVKLAELKLVKTVEDIEGFFLLSVEKGLEGLICKSTTDDSIYQAGARGWTWIKYKRDYKSAMGDTLDLVVVGAFHGRGKRAGTYGALLLASYNSESDRFETVTKCGTGFTDDDLEKVPNILKSHKKILKHPNVKSAITADVWFEPAIVIEVLGAEITLSPVHTCALNSIRKGSGLAVRFPRFTGRYRPDKTARNATTTNEILEMYKKQLKRFSESENSKSRT